VLVTRASSHSALGVRVDDVVLSIDGKKAGEPRRLGRGWVSMGHGWPFAAQVGDDGSVELRESELVSYEFLLTGKQRGELISPPSLPHLSPISPHLSPFLLTAARRAGLRPRAALTMHQQ